MTKQVHEVHHCKYKTRKEEERNMTEIVRGTTLPTGRKVILSRDSDRVRLMGSSAKAHWT